MGTSQGRAVRSPLPSCHVYPRHDPGLERVGQVGPGDDHLVGVIVLLRFPGLEFLTARAVRRPIRFPYVPGLLSFREAPALVAAWGRLPERPDLLLCDGQGIAHPRGLGLASHLGLLLEVPSIGCAKSRLVGEHAEPGPRRGDRAPLRYRGRTVGAVLRTRDAVRPLYVSPGPTRRADHLAGRLSRAWTAGRTGIAISTPPP